MRSKPPGVSLGSGRSGRSRTARFAVVAPVLAGVLVHAACGGGTRSQGGGGGSTGEPAGEVDRTATIRYTQQTTPTSFDPMTSQSELDMLWLTPIYDRLTYVDQAGTAKPQLAESWELAPDGSTLTFKLRTGVTFSDGTPFDATAAKANLERYKTNANSRLKNDILSVASVDAPDASTLVLNLSGPGGALPNVLASRVGMMVSPKAFANPDLDQKPVGAGAMELTAARPDTQYTYTRRDDYWDAEAYRYKTLDTVVNNGSGVVNLLRTDALDVGGLLGPPAKEAEAAGIKLVRSNAISGARILLNPAKSKLQSKEVRQAISLAIDRDALAEVAFNGDCRKTVQPFPEGHFAHSKTVDAERDDWGFTRNVAKAKELMAAAGLAGGFDMDMLVPATPSNETRASLYQQNLAEIGVRVKLKVVDVVQARILFGQGQGDSYAGDGGSYTDPSIFTAQHYLKDGAQNPGDLTDPELTRLVTDAASSDDVSVRTEAYDKVFAKAFELGPIHVYICNHTIPSGVQKNITGMDLFTGAAGNDALRGVAKTTG